MKGLLFTYALTYGGAVAAIFNPWIGLLGYMIFCIVRPEAIWFWAVPPGNYSRILAIAALIGWALQGFGNWRFRRAAPVVWSLVGFFAWSVVCAVQAGDQKRAWECIDVLIKIILPVFVGLTLIDSLYRLKTLVWTLVASQGYISLELNQYYLNGYNMAEEGFGDLGRAVLGLSLVLVLSLSCFLTLTVKARWQSAIAACCALLTAHAVLLTYSRGALLSAILTAGVAFYLIPKRRSYLVLVALALAVTARMVGPSVVERFSTTFVSEEERDASAQGRLELWSNCLDILRKNPVFGIGPENFGSVAPQYGWPLGKEGHNLWLQTAAETGLPGIACLVAFFGFAVLRLWPLARLVGRSSEPWLPAIAAMVVSGLIGFSVGALFVTVTRLEMPYLVGMLGAGVLKISSDSPGLSSTNVTAA